MDNVIDSIDFKNSVYEVLREFITTQFDGNDPLYDVYVVQDYDEVRNAFDKMNDDEITIKPVIHLSLVDPKTGTKTYTNNSVKIQRNYMYYTVYCVIDNNIQSNRKRKFVLNELSDKLKVKFDRYGNNLEKFMQINININSGLLGENIDGLYATQQTLEFRIDKKV